MRWTRENTFDAAIAAASLKYRVPVAVIKAVIAHESGFNPRAKRAEAPRSSLPPTPDHPAGGDESRGLMQLLIRTARLLGYKGHPDGLYDPATSIELGTRLLADNLRSAERRGGGLPDALSQYNGGYRPTLGFGKRKADGKFGNQPYVDRITGYVKYFNPITSTPPTNAPGTPAGSTVPALLLALALFGALLALGWLT